MTAVRRLLPPIDGPVLVSPFGQAIVPDPDGDHHCISVSNGFSLAWTSIDERHLLLPMFFGADRSVAVALTLSHEGLDLLIADLESIREQLPPDRRQSVVDGAPPAPPFAGGVSVDRGALG